MVKKVYVGEIGGWHEFIFKCDADVVSVTVQGSGPNVGSSAELPIYTRVYLSGEIVGGEEFDKKGEVYLDAKEVTCRCSVRREVERAVKRYLRGQGYQRLSTWKKTVCDVSKALCV